MMPKAAKFPSLAASQVACRKSSSSSYFLQPESLPLLSHAMISPARRRKTLFPLPAALALAGFLSASPQPDSATSFVARHGALSVEDSRIVDQQGQALSLAGPSLFWSNDKWQGEAFYNAALVRHVAQDWNAGIIRAAMGVEAKGGYLDSPASNLAKIETIVEAAAAAGIYVIVDWHSHHAEEHLSAAIDFFTGIATKYGHQPNLIYEIYNEPLRHASWTHTIKPYAERVIDAIRAVDPDNLIVVGTPTWSQDVDVASRNPITGRANIAYAAHFYAGSHRQKLRDKIDVALKNGIPIMVTEWGSVAANGDGGIDYEETQLWTEFMRARQLTHCIWSISNKREGSAMIQPHAPASGPWADSELTESGRFARDLIRLWNR